VGTPPLSAMKGLTLFVVCNINHWQSLGQASLATSPNQFQRQKNNDFSPPICMKKKK
jgi:hypothetical protein